MTVRDDKAGMTLVEVLIAVVLVSVAAALVYQGGFSSYRILMRSRLRLEAQGVAFDKLWSLFNMPLDSLPNVALVGTESPPDGGAFSGNGWVRYAVLPETNVPLSRIEYWEISVQVWPASNDVLFTVLDDDGTVMATSPHPLAEYTVLRYRGSR